MIKPNVSLPTLTLLFLSCTPDIVDDEIRTTPSGMSDASSPTDANDPTICPEGLPVIGESCPKDMQAVTRCTYALEDCVFNGNAYPVTRDYCCFLGGWAPCGSNTNPCDNPAPDAAEDAAGDGGTGDAARDLGTDHGPDGGTGDGAQDAPADASASS